MRQRQNVCDKALSSASPLSMAGYLDFLRAAGLRAGFFRAGAFLAGFLCGVGLRTAGLREAATLRAGFLVGRFAFLTGFRAAGFFFFAAGLLFGLADRRFVASGALGGNDAARACGIATGLHSDSASIATRPQWRQ